MKTLVKYVMLIFMGLAIVMTSCTKEGPMGPAGIDGVDGTNGIDGIDGQDGNANVVSKTVDPFPTWELGNYLGKGANTVEFNEPLLDENGLNNSLVLVYFQVFGDDIWYPMTYIFPYTSGQEEVMTFTYELNRINIYAFDSNGPVNAAITKLRYFIIPTNTGSKIGDSNPNFRKMTYEELMNHFGV